MHQPLVRRAVVSVAVSTLGAIAASFFLTLWLAPAFGIEPTVRAYAFALAVPAIIAPLWSIPRARANYLLRCAHQELERLAHTDSLTGLRNRRAFFEEAKAIFASSGADPVGLMMIDVDHFKAVNDRHGHDFGDGVLRGIATSIAKAVTEQTGTGAALVARLGGEEFAVLVTDLDRQTLMELSDRIRASVEWAFSATDPAGVTVSVGVTIRGPGQNIDDALRAADAALYEAKRAGRNRVRLSDGGSLPVIVSSSIAPALPPSTVRARPRGIDAA
jgi:diguanylate cyclase (GGDEF)-like protein